MFGENQGEKYYTQFTLTHALMRSSFHKRKLGKMKKARSSVSDASMTLVHRDRNIAIGLASGLREVTEFDVALPKSVDRPRIASAGSQRPQQQKGREYPPP